MPDARVQSLANTLRMESGTGVAPFGLRHSGLAPKGMGFFGPISMPSGQVMTEMSGEMDGMEFPLVVPTLTRQEIDALSGGGAIPDEIYRKAQAHALMRQAKGLSPFAGPTDLRHPLPSVPMNEAINGALMPSMPQRSMGGVKGPLGGVRG